MNHLLPTSRNLTVLRLLSMSSGDKMHSHCPKVNANIREQFLAKTIAAPPVIDIPIPPRGEFPPDSSIRQLPCREPSPPGIYRPCPPVSLPQHNGQHRAAIRTSPD